MVNKTVLKDNGYKVVHEDSPDNRGIDVALIYEASSFTYKSHTTYRIPLPGERPNTRDILHVEGAPTMATSCTFSSIIGHRVRVARKNRSTNACW